jgi:tRNA pseudouridine32 synthase/23S rRNA pseudouridine746 synthase
MLEPTVHHADYSLLVVEKPAGLLAVPGRGEAGRDHLVGRVQRTYPDALIVHRLDMSTSGLMVLARGAAVHRLLSAAFANRQMVKRYIAVVEGWVVADTGEIDAPLIADWPNRPRQKVDRLHGKPSLTRWRVLERGDGCTRLALEPVTGRSHQLRVHLQSIGHPILGDELYALAPPRAPRLLLHAEHLAFAHPASAAAMAFSSPAPF